MKSRFLVVKVLGIILALGLSSFLPNIVHGQVGTKLECGAIHESEFTDNNQIQVFSLTMQARDSFSVSAAPIGDHMTLALEAYGPSGVRIIVSGWTKTPTLNSGILSARGTYSIKVYNGGAGTGLYTLSIGCVTSNGTVEPGDIPQPPPTPAPLPTPTPRSAIPESAPKFTGIGFPGLAPVDFSSVAEIPLLLDTVMTGVIPTGNEILGFTLDAAAGDTLDLSYTRVFGNMNLGLVVLSASNEVFFQASLVTSESLSTRFTLPEAGQYTIGVFRISLVEPDEVEPTVFQLKGTIVDSGQ
jgi:hypothetical protein